MPAAPALHGLRRPRSCGLAVSPAAIAPAVDALQPEAYRQRYQSKGSAMRYAEILSQSATRTSQQHAARAHAAHCHIHRARVSRRQFIQSAAGLTAFAATLGSSVSGAQVRSEDQVSVLSHRFPQHSPSPVRTSTCRRRPSRERFRSIQRLRLPRGRRHRVHQRGVRADGSRDR